MKPRFDELEMCISEELVTLFAFYNELVSCEMSSLCRRNFFVMNLLKEKYPRLIVEYRKSDGYYFLIDDNVYLITKHGIPEGYEDNVIEGGRLNHSIFWVLVRTV